MPAGNYSGFSLRNRIFAAMMSITFLALLLTSAVSYIILKKNLEEQSAADMRRKADAMMASLDYAVSEKKLETEDLPVVLQNKIYEIADISKHDVLLYDLKGNFLVSNREGDKSSAKKLPEGITDEVLMKERITHKERDPQTGQEFYSSYIILKNNVLEPVAIVYFPYYHNAGLYREVMNQGLKYIILVNAVIISLALLASYRISRRLTNKLTIFTEKVEGINLMSNDLQPIKYYKNDELNILVKAYNKMILEIQDQKDRLAHIEREGAWKEMAKQVAHEVKNPLTPMRLTVQNFERKFDPEDPKIREKVKKMSTMVIDQIDLIATVATAFSQFAQLPERNDEVFNLNAEVQKVLDVFNDENVFMHANRENIMIKMDKIYLNRIVTNLVTNARQAAREGVEPIINVDLEQIQKRITLTVEDNGTGIPEDKIDRIFEPNFTSKSSGMGLGLTMVKRMVQDGGGEIRVETELGKGTKFIITLPSNL